MAEKLNLEQVCNALGLTHSQMASAIQEMSGLSISRTLVTDACNYKPSARPPIAAPKAAAIAKFVSQELGRPVSIDDLGLKVL